MTTTLAPPALTGGEHFVLEDVSWDFYERLLREVGDRPIRITYDDGRLELMSPLPEHERVKRMVGRMIEEMTLELNIPVASFASTTFRRKSKNKGLEPDECYYIQNEKQMRSRKRLDLSRDPPPDLAVEVDITSSSIEREPIYAALGIPELWRFDGRRLHCLKLDAGGQYHAAARSAAFPFLRVADLERFLKMFDTTDETSVMRAFRDWVRKMASS